ncbi:MAG: hypothetical protein WD934_03420 [Gemmatimonadales bacterium]
MRLSQQPGIQVQAVAQALDIHPFLFRSKTDIFAFLETRRGAYAVTRLCALYGVMPGGRSTVFTP